MSASCNEALQAASGDDEGTSQEQRSPRKTPSCILREIGSRPDISSTAELVAAYNASEEEMEQSTLRRWLRGYVTWFTEHSGKDLDDSAYEAYSRLANIKPRSAEDDELLRSVFITLGERARHRRLGEKGCLEATDYVLQTMDKTAFCGDPSDLLELAKHLLSQLVDGGVIFTEGTSAIQRTKLAILHHIFLVVEAVAPQPMPCNQQNGCLVHNFKSQIKRLVKSQSYFPLRYKAKLVEQSLNRLVSDCAPLSENLRRVAIGIRGLAYLYGVLRRLIVADMDVESMGKAWKSFKEAWSGDGLRKDSWYDRLMELRLVCSQADRSAEERDLLVECLEGLSRDQRSLWKGEELRLLRFGILQQLRKLALNAKNEETRRLAAEQLMEVGTRGAFCFGWNDNRDVFEALIEALGEVHFAGEQTQMTEPALAMLALRRDVKHKEVVEEWLDGMPFEDKIQQRRCFTVDSGPDRLFEDVRKEVGVVYSFSNVLEKVDALKRTYLDPKFAQVPAVLDGDSKKHVKDFKHNLVLYSTEFVGHGMPNLNASNLNALHGVRTPIPLEDLFGGLTERFQGSTSHAKATIIYGNPGTGKTSISKKLAYDWASGKWSSHFEALYLVALRTVTKSSYDDSASVKKKTLETVIANECFSLKESSRFGSLINQISDDLDKETTLVILDGLDEGDEVGLEMVSIARTRAARLLLLSRPSMFEADYDREIEVLGLSDEYLVEFIVSELGKEVGMAFINELQAQASIWELAHVPVTAQLLCALRKDGSGRLNRDTFATLFGLYSEMATSAWNRYLAKHTPMEVEKEEVFDTLGKIAVDALQCGEIFISQETIRRHFSSLNVKLFIENGGFLLFSREGNKYHFPHLTYQEFFAGRYLGLKWWNGTLDESEYARRVIHANKYSTSFRLLMSFAMECTCATRYDEGFKGLLSIFNESPIEIIGVQHLFLQARLIEAFLNCVPIEYHSLIDDLGIKPIIQKVVLLAEVATTFLRLENFVDDRNKKNILMEFEIIPKTIERFREIYRVFLKSVGDIDVTNIYSMLPMTVSRLAKKTTTLTRTLLEDLSALCASDDESIRRGAMYWIQGVVAGRPELSEEVMRLLRVALRDTSTRVRNAALSALGEVVVARVEFRKEAFQFFYKACYDENKAFRTAALTLATFLCAERPMFFLHLAPLLRKSYQKGKPDFRCIILAALNRAPLESPETLREAMELLNAGCSDGDRDIRIAALCTLQNVVSKHHQVLDEAIRLLRQILDEDKDERSRAVAVIVLRNVSNLFPQVADQVAGVISDCCKDPMELILMEGSNNLQAPKTLRSLLEEFSNLPSEQTSRYIIAFLFGTSLTITKNLCGQEGSYLTMTVHTSPLDPFSKWQMRQDDVLRVLTELKKFLDAKFPMLPTNLEHISLGEHS